METKIRYISINGKPQMQITADTRVLKIKIYNTWKRKVKRIDDYTFQIPVSIGLDFFQENKELYGSYFSAKVADNSITKYYGFQDLYSNTSRYSTELTEKFIQKFNERGDAMIRYEVNNTNELTNSLGMKMPEFEHCLYRNSFYEQPEIGDFTETEFNAFVNALGNDCGVVQEIQKNIVIKNMDETDVESAEREVLRFENKVNDIIEKYRNEIIDFKKTLPEHKFDCGFTIIKTADSELKAKYNILYNHEKRRTENVEINFPHDYLNSSHSYKVLDFIKDKTNDKQIQSLYANVILD